MNQNIATLRAASLPAAPCSFDGPVSQPRRTLDPASHAVVLCLLSTVNDKALAPTYSYPCLNAASVRAPVQATLSGKFYESRHIRPPGSLDGCLKSCTRYLVSFRLYTLSNRAVFSFFSRKCLQDQTFPLPDRTYKLAVSRIFATRRRGQFYGLDIAVQNTGKQRYASVSTSGSCRNSPLRPRTFVVGELASVLLMDGGRK